MAENSSAARLWAQSGLTGNYEAWQFGDAPDELACLTASGVKTATAGLYLWYELEDEPLPKVGAYSVVIDSRNRAVCIIQTTNVTVLPFNQVPASHAYLEGEGDRTLAYWREVHERFFTQELREIHREFDEHMLVVCEQFRRVF